MTSVTSLRSEWTLNTLGIHAWFPWITDSSWYSTSGAKNIAKLDFSLISTIKFQWLRSDAQWLGYWTALWTVRMEGNYCRATWMSTPFQYSVAWLSHFLGILNKCKPHGFPLNFYLPAFECKSAAEDSLELFSEQPCSLCAPSECKCHLDH